MSTKDISDLQVCVAFVKKDDPLEQWPYQILMRETGEPEKVCYRACERACDRGYIEYGVSLRSGWLTEKGKELIKIAAQNTKESTAHLTTAASQNVSTRIGYCKN